jgi:transcription elongation factor GreA
MPDEPILLTPDGKAKLEAELAELVRKRPALAEQMASAREDRGELAQDAAYVDTMTGQGMVEARIQELQHILGQAELIGEGEHRVTETVQPGYTVAVVDQSGHEATYTIVGSVEADPVAGRISNVSPIGGALVGKRKGESVEVEVPAGTLRLTIKQIQ